MPKKGKLNNTFHCFLVCDKFTHMYMQGKLSLVGPPSNPGGGVTEAFYTSI